VRVRKAWASGAPPGELGTHLHFIASIGEVSTLQQALELFIPRPRYTAKQQRVKKEEQ
jgi:hypothetical protein